MKSTYWKTKHRESLVHPAFVWSIEHYLSFTIYLVFVWGVAYMRRDYLWIPGDDANLLQQSLLITKGFVPNLDFFSGYPGLSLQLHAVIIKLFGVEPLTQHIYVGLQATALGAVLFFVAKNVKPWLVLLLLFFIYSQSMWINSTPNPGYLFDIAFILGLKKSLDYFECNKLLDAMLAGFYFAIAFLAKQYGIFGPVCFFIASLALLSVRPLLQKVIFCFALSFASGSILYIYFVNLIPNTAGFVTPLPGGVDRYHLLVRGAALFILPTLVSLISIFALQRSPSEKAISIRTAFKANWAVTGTFLVVVMLYFIWLYGANHIFYIVREIMFVVPSRLNGWLFGVDFSRDHYVYIVYALLIIFLPLLTIHYVGRKSLSVFYTLAGTSAALLLFKFRTENLFGTPFLSVTFVAIVGATFILMKGDRRRHLLAVLAGFAPIFLILIPFPNYEYHIPILIFFILLCYPSERLIRDNNHYRLLTVFGLLPYAMLVFIGWSSMRDVPRGVLHTYTFGNLKFRSSDQRWSGVIAEASQVESGAGVCSTDGCRYLLLTLPTFTNYDKLIEKPTPH